MNRQTSPLSTFRFAALAAATLAALALTGCSMDTSIAPATISTESVSMPAISGRVMGGENPVASTSVTLWETDPGNTGYGLAATVLAGPVSSSSPGGNFTFTTGYTCTLGNFVYVTSTGGDTSNGGPIAITNNNLVMISALGSCADFANATAQGNVRVVINELTTVAAAYALGNFMKVNENGAIGTQTVYIGAPAKNNSTTGSCSGTGTAMTCTAAGLAHAFANATNLVDTVHYDGTQPSGAARTAIPGNPTSSVPQAVINSLGNILQYCTNSAGTSSGAGDGTNCGTLFADATPVGPTSPTAPADTLSAAINIAKQPYNNVGSGTCTGASGGLYCLASSNPAFVPNLAASPHDWSLAVAYSGTSANSFSLSSYSISAGTVTFQAPNTLTPGLTVTFSGFPTSTFLNGQTVTVLSAGLSNTQFEATLKTTSITAYSITSNVSTFTAANSFIAGQQVTLSGFPSSTFFNGQTVTVLSTGLSSSQFEANFTDANVSSTTEAGTATIASGSATESGTATDSMTGSFGSPSYLTLDANDNVYVQTGSNYTATSGGIAAMTASGIGLWNNPVSTSYCTGGEVATDTNGFVWSTVSPASTGACSWGIYGYSAATGALTYAFGPGSGTVCSQTTPTSTNCPGFPASGYDTTHAIQSAPKAIAFDHFNNLWYGRTSSSCTQCLFDLAYTSGSPGTYAGPTNIQNTVVYPNQMIIDTNQNIWIGNASPSSGTSGILYLLPNTGSAAAPTYPATPGYVKVTLSSYDNGGISLDSAGNVWTGSNLNVYEYTPTVNGASSTFGSPTSQSAVTAASHPTVGEIDGNNVYWYGSLTASGSIYIQNTPLSPLYSSTAANNTRTIRPCYAPSGASTCDIALGTTTYQTGDPKSLQVDSAGSIWVSAGVAAANNSGFVVQILGVAAPTWPQYSYGVFAKEPQ